VFPVKYELGLYIPEDDILHSYSRENLKSYIFIITIMRNSNPSFWCIFPIYYHESNRYKQPLVKIHASMSVLQRSNLQSSSYFTSSVKVCQFLPLFRFEITSELRSAES
jgi:hypothetical protein